MTREQADRIALHATRRFIRASGRLPTLERLSLIYGDTYVRRVFDRYERRYHRRRWWRR